MARQIRIHHQNAWYHVMNRASSKRYIFSKAQNKETLIELMSEVYRKYNIEFHVYCIMDNHYHFLIRTPNANLSDAMKYLQGMFTRIYNKENNSDGSIFRGRYKSILLDSQNALLQVCRYIHLNPIEANITLGLNYEWSSYKYYTNNNIKPNWLVIDYILSCFNSVKQNLSFIDFHKGNNTDQITTFYSEIKKQNFSVLNDVILNQQNV